LHQSERGNKKALFCEEKKKQNAGKPQIVNFSVRTEKKKKKKNRKKKKVTTTEKKKKIRFKKTNL